MIKTQLSENFTMLLRFGFYRSALNCHIKKPYVKAINLKSDNNTCRLYHCHSHKLLNMVDGHYFSKRLVSTENMVPMHSGIFAYLSECPATNYFKEFVVFIHDSTGLPWWATIIFCTFILRTLITVPLAAYQANNVAKLENITLLEMPEKARELQKETTLKARQLSWPANKANLYYKINLKKKLNELIVRDNCHPFKSAITVWFQLPTWVFFSAAMRNLAYMLPHRTAETEVLFMKLSVGGFLWIPNLTQPDGLLILPILLGLSNLSIIEIQAMMRLREPTKLQRYATNFFRGFSIALIPISATVPTAVCLYWTTSSLMGLGQNLLLMSHQVRKLCRIPDTPSTYDHPYQQLIFEIKEKNRKLFTFLRRKS